VIVVACVLFAIEFVVDKVPWLDSAWDSIHTIVRPGIGSFVGLSFAGDASASQIDEILAAGGSGGTALASHAVKAGIRLGVNASPEPFSNIAISLLEDGLVFTVAAFAINHPVLAAAVAGALLVLGLCAVVLLWTAIRRALRRRRSAAGPDPPGA
jgi:hypothetical protein